MQADPAKLHDIVRNLVENAIRATSAGGLVEISVTRSDAGIDIAVTDSGPGVSDEALNRIFEPYFSTKKSGTGLGLAIAHTIITEHNGTIKVQDNHPTGAVFIVELPLDS